MIYLAWANDFSVHITVYLLSLVEHEQEKTRNFFFVHGPTKKETKFPKEVV